MVTSVKVRAPSSTANLGPGFDVFGLALDAFHDEITLTKKPWRGVRILTADDIPKDPQQNTAGLVIKSMKQKFKIKSGIEIRIKKGVPAGFGMGSSAASAAAAALACNRLFNLKLDNKTLVKYAGIGEKASAGTIHYDNVAASLLGGFVVVKTKPFDVIRLEPPKDLVLCVAIPKLKVPKKKTKVSRAVIPKTVKLSDLTENLSNAANIVSGFLLKDSDLIGRSIQDVIVEPARKHLIPGFSKVKNNALDAGALGVTISGAGPSVIAFCKKSQNVKKIAKSMENGFRLMQEDLKVKFNELIRDLQSVDMNKIQTLETQLQDMVTKTKEALDLIGQDTKDVIVAVLDSGAPSKDSLAWINSSFVEDGYDFVRSTDSSFDGDGIDNDPTDPDFLPVNSSGNVEYGSHGSHVATTISAKNDGGS